MTERSSASANEPKSGRPLMSAGYGIEKTNDGQLPWSWATERLTDARNYWLCTIRPDGRPHAMPVWALWLEGALYFSTDPASQKGRNLAANPQAVVNLESGDDAVILDGMVEMVSDGALLARLSELYEAKYQFKLEPGPAFGIYTLRPSVAHAWREQDFPKSATRWRFAG